MYARNASNHATAVLYAIEKMAHPLLFVSSAMLATVAMQGKKSRINTINAIAERGLKSPDAFMSCSMPSSELLLYIFFYFLSPKIIDPIRIIVDPYSIANG